MKTFWPDSNVFMQAKNLYYAFDIAPGFWRGVSECAKSGSIKSPMMVYNEIAKGGDELTAWAKTVTLFVDPSKKVQETFSKIAEYVVHNGAFHPAQAALFLKGADAWVISSAIAENGVVVTHEKLVGADSTKVKIPNVCKHFGVDCVSCYDMIRKLGIVLK